MGECYAETYLVPSLAKRLAEEFLAVPVPIHVCCVEKIAAELDSLLNRGYGGLIVCGP